MKDSFGEIDGKASPVAGAAPSPHGDIPTATLPTPSLFAILPYIMLPMALAVADQTIVSTALPAIAGSLGGVTRISWVVVATLVSATIAAPVYGQLRDVVGSRPMMLIALGIYMGASLVSAASTSFAMLVVGRVLQGLGGGGLMTLSQALIGEAIPPRERAKYQGYLAAVMVTATTAGPLLGGYLTAHFGWRSIFVFNLPLAGIAVLLTLIGPARSVSPRAGWSFDYSGLMLFVGFIAPLLIALDAARQLTTETLPGLLLLVVVSAVSLVWLLRHELAVPFPLFPVALLRQRTIWMSDLLAATHGAVLVSLVILLPLYLHVMRETTAAETGLLLLPLMLGIGTGSMITGRLVSRTGRTALFPRVGLCFAAVMLTAQAFGLAYLTLPQLGFSLFAAGMAMGTVMGVVQVTVQAVAGRSALGAAAASVQIARSVGAAVGAAATGAVLLAAVHMGAPDATRVFEAYFELRASAVALPAPEVSATIALAFKLAFLAIAAFACAGAVVAWLVPERRL